MIFWEESTLEVGLNTTWEFGQIWMSKFLWDRNIQVRWRFLAFCLSILPKKICKKQLQKGKQNPLSLASILSTSVHFRFIRREAWWEALPILLGLIVRSNVSSSFWPRAKRKVGPVLDYKRSKGWQCWQLRHRKLTTLSSMFAKISL